MKSVRYCSEFAENARILIRHGIEENQVAVILGISPEQLTRWKQKHPDFQSALNQPRTIQQAEAALLKRALGFRQEEATSEEMVDKTTGEVLDVLKRRTITKEVPPDVRALLFWLKNRCPDRWAEHPEDEYAYEAPEDEENL